MRGWQEQLILAEPGDTVKLPEGIFSLTQTLSIDNKQHLVLTGQGRQRTILDFADQIDGGEGLRITNSDNIILRGFTVRNARGDAIKAQYTSNIQFHDVGTTWAGRPRTDNGAYGIYPVQCERVLVMECYAYGASDAGIYIGQSDQVVVRKCLAEGNVAGIEIENTTRADVVDNIARGNTGGILIFDLPDLEKKQGGHVRVFGNKVSNNNLRNFAPKGNIVAQVPPGTGIMVMATSDVEIFENTVTNNRTVGAAVMSYYITELPITDPSYDPYPARIYIHDNHFERPKKWPLLKNKFGWLFLFKFGRKVPNVVYDGIPPDHAVTPSGRLLAEYEICIDNNTGGTFANLDAANKFKNLSRDVSLFQCR